MATKTKVGPEVELGQVVLLPPDLLEPMTNQPRRAFDADLIREMADKAMDLFAQSQGIQGTGFIDVVKFRLPSGALDADGRLVPGVKLPIYSGETRWRAANFANERRPNSLPFLPCVGENVTEDEAFELAYFANLHRRNLNDLDDALALLRIKNQHDLTLEQLAKRIRVNNIGVIQNKIDVAKADPDVWEIFTARPNEKVLSIARRISRVKDDPKLRRDLIKRAKKNATFKEIDDRVKAHNEGISYEDWLANQRVVELERKGENEAKKASRTELAARSDTEIFADEIKALTSRAQEARNNARGASFTTRERRELGALAKKFRKTADELTVFIEGEST